MSDDPKKKIPQDASRININEPYEVEYWCKKFGCAKQELIDAVEINGTSAVRVEEYLKKKK